MKTIRCPHCQSPCEIGTGYYHDEKLNIRCNRCHQVILATSEEDEKPLLKLYTRPTKETNETGSSWPYHGGRNYAGVHHHGHATHQPGHGHPGMMAGDYDGEYGD